MENYNSSQCQYQYTLVKYSAARSPISLQIRVFEYYDIFMSVHENLPYTLYNNYQNNT
ncbi:hypothetical protein [Anabaena sp. UHCC 0253]|uniref:hypothetical protein n=1 Tax=Anabaena sp. UHCC 0253 TaxID=2590019 RepID=UPI0014474BAB|nr:hypothetical protein [Anabaena sp. UHCC 0253]